MMEKGHLHIDITWYPSVSEVDVTTPSHLLETPAVTESMGKEGLLVLIIKNPKKQVQKGNIWGVTVSSHLSKLQPTAYYASKDIVKVVSDTMGGLYLMGGMPGVSIIEVVRLSLMTHHVAKAHEVDHDHLIWDAKEFFDRIRDTVLQTVGEHIWLGTKGEPGPQTKGYTTRAQMGLHAMDGR